MPLRRVNRGIKRYLYLPRLNYSDILLVLFGVFMTKLVIYKSNDIIEASYRLSLNEQRIVLACIGQINSKESLLEISLSYLR